ncbi:sensor histidine kinase [Acetonema longum]|uniref:histidine kinase n=1 Tax=Acetonema longum DSM 6540 TaxID=1009370 RepID=F7NGP5_9FIRM|nr:HAMP domain-containing sensor histidine kinase [Acetonema longum]EGO64849.1 two-component sensor histidine kinase [Acetonema longum DSM 6540]
MTRSIFGRILMSHMAVILVSILALSLLMSFLIRSHVVINRRADLITKANSITAFLAPDIKTGKLPSPEVVERLNEMVGGRVWLTDEDGRVLVGQPPPRWFAQFPQPAEDLDDLFAGLSNLWVGNDREEKDRSMVIALPVAGAPNPVAVYLFAPVTGINRAVAALDKLLYYSLLFGIGASVILGFFITRTLTRPLADISRAASRFAKGEHASRTAAVGEDEIGRLGQVFNDMAASLAHTEQNRRDFLANVSHELKTPVAAIQAMAEALADGMVTTRADTQRYLANIVSQTGHINRLVQDLLDLAQLEAGEITILREKVDLAEFLARETEKMTTIALSQEKKLKFVLQKPQKNDRLAAVWADPVRLTQVFNNIGMNAIRYSPEGSEIKIRIETKGRFSQFTVTDQGPGIQPEDLPYIWERFYRAEKSRTRNAGGCGLGLAIVRDLVRAMGGEAEVESPPGKGAAFTIRLPVAKQ